VIVSLALGALLVGLIVLVKAADLFVAAAEGIALHRHWSPAVIGAVVVGFGTSLPELVTSAVAAVRGEAELAIGNAAGSNVANLLLVLGVAALVAPIRGTGRGPGRDVAIASVGGALLAALALRGRLGLIDGVVLLGVLGATVWWQVLAGRSTPLEVEVRGPGRGPLAARVLGGLIGVVVGAQLLVWGASTIATELGVPPIVVGSILVAVGTSLPELATAVASARRGQTELLIGNLIGSNAFNALGVVGVAAIVSAARGDAMVVTPPALAVVIAGAAVTAGVGGWLWRRPRMGRVAGGLLVAVYVAAVPALMLGS
jgi:cation:H+ antiporter